jgi:RecQ family ATP-dependent DNA helicase
MTVLRGSAITLNDETINSSSHLAAGAAWSDRLADLRHLAHSVFGHAELRFAQIEALKLITENDRALITLPTGSGKSLLYGLLAIREPGLTIVVSPLTALKREQAVFFRKAGINAAHLSFDQQRNEREGVWELISAGALKLLFVSPERFVSNTFVSRLLRTGGVSSGEATEKSTVSLSRIFIDEAHCMASWGYDFRPEYRQIGHVLGQLGVAKVVALTATASPKTRELIQSILRPMSAVMLSPPIGAHVSVESVRISSEVEREKWLSDMIASIRSDRKVIAYVQRRVDAEQYAQRFRGGPCRTICYHAGMTAEVRAEVEEYIRSHGGPMVIFATQAFGMGINLPEVDHVVVCGFPSGIEELLQMLGRAGRGGEAARGTLIWTGSDPVKRVYGIKKSLPFPTRLEALLAGWQQWLSEIHAGGAGGEGGGGFVTFSAPQLALFLQQAQAGDVQAAPQKKTAKSAKPNKPAEPAWNLENFVHVLRMGEVLAALNPGGPLLVFASQSLQLFFDLRDELRGSDSQRLRVLELICAAASSSESLSLSGPIFRSIPLFDALADTRLSLSQLERVAAALSMQPGLEIQIVVAPESPHSAAQYLAAPWCLDIRGTVARYRAIRDERMRGFEVLDSFARSESCRLQNVFSYLEGKKHPPCGQCDRCFALEVEQRKQKNAAANSSSRKGRPISLEG